MKLFPLLFEDLEPKKITSYTAPAFALFVTNETRLVLVHTNSLLAYLQTNDDNIPVLDICAGMIECSERENDCLGAMQVSLAVASPSWKGAGITLYALASDYFGAPLTSDRKHSSSKAAKETWAKIEQNSEWRKAGDGLDNYATTPDGKLYVDVTGTYPNRSAKPRVTTQQPDPKEPKKVGAQETQPRTPQVIDDCPLPTKYGDVSDPERMAELVGTADAYKYNGPLKAAPLLAQAEQVKKQAADPRVNPRKVDLLVLVKKMSTVLFGTRYQGSDTPR